MRRKKKHFESGAGYRIPKRLRRDGLMKYLGRKFRGPGTMKEGSGEKGFLGSAVFIVEESHQINTEAHLRPFFSQAFQNRLSYENSKITKAPIRHYASLLFSLSPSTTTAFLCLSISLSDSLCCSQCILICFGIHFIHTPEMCCYLEGKQ